MPYEWDADDLHRHVMRDVATFLVNFEIYLEHEGELEDIEGILKFIPKSIWPNIDRVAYFYMMQFLEEHDLEGYSRLESFGDIPGHHLGEMLALLLKIAWHKGYLMYKFRKFNYIPL